MHISGWPFGGWASRYILHCETHIHTHYYPTMSINIDYYEYKPSSGTEPLKRLSPEGKSGKNGINRTKRDLSQGLWLNDPTSPLGNMVDKKLFFL